MDFPDSVSIKREITRIRNGLRCTEAEAFFMLRSFLYPPPESRFEKHPESAGGLSRRSRGRALHFTRDLISKLEESRFMVEHGDFSFLLGALELCGATGFPLPSWVSERVQKAYTAYRRRLVATVDEAFGAETPLHYKDEKHWKRFCTSVDIHNRCLALKKSGMKIGEAKTGGVFEIVGGEFGVSPSTVRDYHYAWEKIVGTPQPNRRRGRPPGKRDGKKKISRLNR